MTSGGLVNECPSLEDRTGHVHWAFASQADVGVAPMPVHYEGYEGYTTQGSEAWSTASFCAVIMEPSAT